MGQHLEWMFGKLILLFYILFVDTVCCATGHNEERGRLKKVSFFHRYSDCLVIFYYKGHRVNSTLDYEGNYLDTITAQFVAFGRPFVIDLHLNKKLFSGSYVEKVFHSHGQSTETNHISHRRNNCYYHGKLKFLPESEAALSTCDGLRGYIIDRQDTYHIEHVSGNVHRVYRNKDQRRLPFKCGTEGHDPRLHSHQLVIGRHKRSIKAPYDSNSNTRYVELYLVNDYRTFERHGKVTDVVIRRSQDIANIVSSLYRQLNIYVALVGVEVWAGGDLVSITTSADNTMENFLRYRKERINPYHHNDNAQLITGVFFDHGVVGKAIKGPICTHQFSGGVNMDYGGLVSLVATTVAHEMGHNFGMEHDNDTVCECRDDKCIMAATSGQISPRRWSSCSQNALAEAFDLGMDYCLRNLPTTIYDGPICGNGFKEDGEECDCGLPQDCTNRCCNASSCTLHPLAKCATGRCCDLDKCKPKAASTLCKEPVSECDLAEFCDGISEDCPADVYVQNGQQCKGGQSYCYSGQCKTHTDQCKLLWGDTGRVSDPICFQQLNMNGNSDGNCGYNWTTDRYKRCDRENVMCGLLHCVHLNEKLMFWRDNLAIDMRASFLSRGNKQYVCRSAMLDVGLDMPDPGFVPDGAKCEEDKICISQQCVALAKLKIEQCPNNCHGHGVCNSKGNCHCNIGYAPPDCDRPGYGGSVDSGPASDEYASAISTTTSMVMTGIHTNTSDSVTNPGAKKDILIALLVVFLLVLPLIVLGVIAFLNRQRLIKWWKLMSDFKYRFRGKPQPPQPNPIVRHARKDFTPPSHQEGHVSSHILHMSDVHTKPKIWDSGSSGTRNPAPTAPPERPAAPRRPPVLVKSSSSTENKSTVKKVRLSIPIQETGGPTSSSSKQKLTDQCVTSMTSKQESAKNIPQSPKSNPIMKRESFRGSEISDPILVCTTNRNSLVLADGKVDIIGPEAKLVSKSPPVHRSSAITVKRSQSERPVSKPDPLRPSCVPPTPALSTLKKSESARSPPRVHTPAVATAAKTNPSGFRSRPVPPIPTYEDEDDTQPIYTNESSDVSDLLSAIQGALKDSCNLYNNMPVSDIIHSPIQETAPPAPPRPVFAKKPGPATQSNATSVARDITTQPSPRNASIVQRLPNSALVSTKIVNDSKPKSIPASGISADKSDSVNKPVFNISTVDKKPEAVNSKSSIASENSLKLKDVVSEELRNKILSRSNNLVQPQANSSASQKPRTSSATSITHTPQIASTISAPSAGTNKPQSTKVPSTDGRKPGPRPGATDNQQPANKRAAAKIISHNSDLDQDSSTVGANRPSHSKAKATGNAPAGKTPSISSVDTRKPSSSVAGGFGIASGARNNPRSVSRDKVPSESKPTQGTNSSVSNLAAKFIQSSDSAGDKSTQSKISEDAGKKPATRSVFQTEKPALPGKPKFTSSAKPDISELSPSSLQSVSSSSRPALHTKQADSGGPSSTPPASLSAQPKRVQSFRI